MKHSTTTFDATSTSDKKSPTTNDHAMLPMSLSNSTELPLDLFINQLSDALIICDNDLSIMRWNKAAEEMYGWTTSEAIGQNIDVLLGTEWIKTPQNIAIQELIQYGVWRGEILQHTKDKRSRFIWTTVSWLKDPANTIIGGIVINRDMTNEKLMEAVAQERQRLEIMLRKEHDWNLNVEKVIKTLFHDMRIPLNVIGTSTGLLSRQDTVYAPEQRQEKYLTVKTQMRRLSNMIDEAATLLRGGGKEKIYDPRKVNLAHLCEASINEIRDSVASPRHNLVFENDPSIQYVKVDETLISRVLLNLLSNAVKYSPKGGEIKLKLYPFENALILEVSDQGVGISEEDQAHIFDIFFRSEQVKNISGTGLGLNIVRECVQAHQGSITVLSKPGQGSTFIVAIPHIPVDDELLM